MFDRKLWAAVAAAALLAAPAPAADGDKYLNRTKLEEGLELLAAQIVDVLTRREAAELQFGEVVCPADKADPHGAWLQNDLTVRIERLKVKVTPTATYTLRVEYGYERRDGALAEVYLLASLRKGKESVELPKLKADDMRDKLRMSAVCVSLPAAGTGDERDDALAAARKEPSVHLSGEHKSRVSADPKSKCYVELLVGPKGGKEKLLERTATVQSGAAVAKIDKDEEYRVRITNASASEVACRVYIDGIDVFEFTDDRQKSGEPTYKHVIVPAGKSVEVPGWHKTATKERKDNWRAFVVTEFGQGAASRIDPKGPVGTVKVVFARSYDPNDAQITPRAGAMETGFGRDIDGPQAVVARRIDPPRECVVVRYTRGTDPAK